jgi:hypothetical protein
VVVPAVAGPFDLGNVVVRAGLHVDPETAQVSALSDPIPQILEGIPLGVRDIRVHVDRPNFTLNPTNCEPMAIEATVFGNSGAVALLSNRFQVADCANLGFKPKLKLNLKGGTKRGAHPALRAVVRAKSGHANISQAVVKLPRSAFLDQAHIRTICTRVQFAADQCPQGSIYGSARAETPLLDYALEGPVYLRSSDNKLPDMVVVLRGPDSQPIEIELAGRIDSVKGGIRSSFESVPDAPVSKFVLNMQGGKKGLIVNSRNLCAGKNRANAKFVGQNGKVHEARPKVVAVDCKKSKRKKARSHKRGG